MTLVLMTWLWTTAASALLLLTLMALQRVLIGPASGRRRSRPVVLCGMPEPVVHVRAIETEPLAA